MDDDYFMKEAIAEANRALRAGEIPVGAVVVRGGKIIGRGRNRRAETGSPLAHAELEALKNASVEIKNWRFDGCVIYITLEPCAMCAGALVQCRMSKIVYGAKDRSAGAAGSLYDIPRDPRMYHRCSVTRGVMEEECAKLLHVFFKRRRKERTVF